MHGVVPFVHPPKLESARDWVSSRGNRVYIAWQSTGIENQQVNCNGGKTSRILQFGGLLQKPLYPIIPVDDDGKPHGESSVSVGYSENASLVGGVPLSVSADGSPVHGGAGMQGQTAEVSVDANAQWLPPVPMAGLPASLSLRCSLFCQRTWHLILRDTQMSVFVRMYCIAEHPPFSDRGCAIIKMKSRTEYNTGLGWGFFFHGGFAL